MNSEMQEFLFGVGWMDGCILRSLQQVGQVCKRLWSTFQIELSSATYLETHTNYGVKQSF